MGPYQFRLQTRHSREQRHISSRAPTNQLETRQLRVKRDDAHKKIEELQRRFGRSHCEESLLLVTDEQRSRLRR
ncbi:hypothetical protein CRG98_048373 [Punica granatum]|uniref:Uncharacterized protein n=1 Tax=Punica granatum TaxID=22663 RepID=A0A2I0HIS9_PUNGR|nr:hypothetical protein CRG98_048373 [Punica granatum]